jgi:hypothetical protein
MAGIREAADGAKQIQATMGDVLAVVGLVAGALGLAAVVYEFLQPPKPAPASFTSQSTGCTTCLEKLSGPRQGRSVHG